MKTIYQVRLNTGWSNGPADDLGKYKFDTYEEARAAASEAQKALAGTPAEKYFRYYVSSYKVMA